MQISLRRAAKIRNRVNAKIQELERELRDSLTIRVNIHDTDILEQIQKGTSDSEELIARLTSLSTVLANLRTLIGRANAEEGVDELLTQLAADAKKLEMFRILNYAIPRASDAQITSRVAGEVERLKVVTQSTGTTMMFDVVPEKTLYRIKETCRDLQSNIDALQDKVEAINSTTKIDVSSADESLLVAEKII